MDLPTSIVIAAATVMVGGISMKVFGNNSKAKSVSPEQCVGNREEIKKNLARGEKKFDKLFEEVENQGKTLARIDERTLIWAKQDGFER